MRWWTCTSRTIRRHELWKCIRRCVSLLSSHFPSRNSRVQWLLSVAGLPVAQLLWLFTAQKTMRLFCCSTMPILLHSKLVTLYYRAAYNMMKTLQIGESLPPEASRILHYLSPELPTQLAQNTACGIHSSITGNASIWESSDLQETFSIMNPFGAGWHLDRASFDESLRDAVRTVCSRSNSIPGSPRKLEKARFLGVDKDAGSWIISAEGLESKDKRRYRSKWIVDATGRKASLARKVNYKSP